MNVEQLIERIRQNDQQAMKELYLRYVGELSSICYRYMTAESDAKDVLQNSFVRIFTSIAAIEYQGEAPFKGWMRKVVVNEALIYLKARKRLKFAEQEAADLQDETDDEPDAEQISADELHQLIAQLPEGYRTVLNYYFSDRSSLEHFYKENPLAPGLEFGLRLHLNK